MSEEEINTCGYRNVDDLWWDLQNKIHNETSNESVQDVLNEKTD